MIFANATVPAIPQIPSWTARLARSLGGGGVRFPFPVAPSGVPGQPIKGLSSPQPNGPASPSILTMTDCPQVRQIFAQFKIQTVRLKYSISRPVKAAGDARSQDRREVLVQNF
jgi:hypothetical protein